MINGVDVAGSGGERREESIYLMSPRNIDLVSCSSNLSAFSPCLTQVFFHTSLEAVFLIFFLLFLFSSLCPRVLRELRHRRAILGDVGAPLAPRAALSQRWERHLVVNVGGLLAASATPSPSGSGSSRRSVVAGRPIVAAPVLAVAAVPSWAGPASPLASPSSAAASSAPAPLGRAGPGGGLAKVEVDVDDPLLAVHSLRVQYGLLVILVVVHVLALLLVGEALLPLGVHVGSLAGLPRVELGLLLLGLLLLPLVQRERLGLLLPGLLGRALLLLLTLGLVAGLGLLGVGGDVVLVLLRLHLVLERAPVVGAAALALVHGLDASSLVSALAIIVALPAAAATFATATTSEAAATPAAASSSAAAAHSLAALSALAALAPLASLADRLVAAGAVAVLAVAAVIAVLPLALGRLAGVQHPLALEAIVAVLLIISVTLAALVVAVVVPPVPRGRVEARLRSRVLPRRRRLGALLRRCSLLSLLRRDLFGVDDEEVLDVGLLALLVEEQGELVAHPDPVVVLHRR